MLFFATHSVLQFLQQSLKLKFLWFLMVYVKMWADED